MHVIIVAFLIGFGYFGLSLYDFMGISRNQKLSRRRITSLSHFADTIENSFRRVINPPGFIFKF